MSPNGTVTIVFGDAAISASRRIELRSGIKWDIEQNEWNPENGISASPSGHNGCGRSEECRAIGCGR